MKFYVGVTDNDWFAHLSIIDPVDVNFWQPGGSTPFKVIESGAPFLFKLKSPFNAIGGVGFFSSHTFLPISVAWEIFKNRNGCESFKEFKGKIISYRKDRQDSNPTIGCVVLTSPIFFDQGDWIEAPSDWSRSIVQGKSYDTLDSNGFLLWSRVQEIVEKYTYRGLRDDSKSHLVLEPDSPQYGNPILTNVRLGQGAFRVLVTDAYQRKCSISGEKTLPVLEAAHIKSYSESGPNRTSNGLLLRSDIHKLFDNGYMTITPEYRVEVSTRIKAEFENGKEYYRYHGQKLVTLPSRETDKPNLVFIDWHNTNVFRS